MQACPSPTHSVTHSGKAEDVWRLEWELLRGRDCEGYVTVQVVLEHHTRHRHLHTHTRTHTRVLVASIHIYPFVALDAARTLICPATACSTCSMVNPSSLSAMTTDSSLAIRIS